MLWTNKGKERTKEVRKNRKPRGMDKLTFKKFNTWLLKNGHNKRDESFSVGNPTKVNMSIFGPLYYVFPIGKFSYSWAETQDINKYDTRTGWGSLTVDSFFDPIVDDYHSELEKPFEEYFYTDTGIKKAYDNGYELWINCKKYYYFKIDPELIYWNKKNQKLERY